MKHKIALLAALGLVACGQGDPEATSGDGGDLLDRSALESGLVSDENALMLIGRFSRSSERGAGQFCARPGSDGEFNVGMLVAFGDDAQCEAQGIASLDGENLSIRLINDDAECTIDASFDGFEVVLPDEIDDACNAFCTEGASFSGADFAYDESGEEAAAATRGRAIESLCPPAS